MNEPPPRLPAAVTWSRDFDMLIVDTASGRIVISGEYLDDLIRRLAETRSEREAARHPATITTGSRPDAC